MASSLMILVLLGTLLSGAAGKGQDAYPDPAPYDRILKKFVDAHGRVDYKRLKDRGRNDLETYVRAVEKTDPDAMATKEKLALYINAYNAFTLKLVVDHYPVESIRKIPGVSGITSLGQWTEKMWNLNGEKVSLNGIENDLVRPMGDPRIHFALVCASIGCPPLAQRAYTALNLDAMLDEQAHRFNQSPVGLQTGEEKSLFRDQHVLRLSSIYKWYKQDFLTVAEDLPAYVLPFTNARSRAFIEKNRENLKIKFMKYDWNLNAQP